MNGNKVARGLGWFSLGLGLYETVAPERLALTLGMTGSEGLLRFYGLREIAAGVGLVSETEPAPAWVWARVAGDLLDLTTLTAALLRRDNPKRVGVAVALASVAGITALDVLCARDLSR